MLVSVTLGVIALDYKLDPLSFIHCLRKVPTERETMFRALATPWEGTRKAIKKR